MERDKRGQQGWKAKLKSPGCLQQSKIMSPHYAAFQRERGLSFALIRSHSGVQAHADDLALASNEEELCEALQKLSAQAGQPESMYFDTCC